MKRLIYLNLMFLFSLIIISGCVSTEKDNKESSVLCGNGQIDPGEQCDDGNTLSNDGCSDKCQIESFCGNGIVEPGEECDDGNYDNDDGCNEFCGVEVGCGNGKLDVGEECDDDNLISGDGCSTDCLDEDGKIECGNGIVEPGEGCDDGNNEDGDGCDSNCKREDGCGNGKTEAGEQCDDGNNVSGDGCTSDCKIEFICGDNQCDEKNHESCELCPTDCCPNCGNGKLDEGEECDDGDNVPGDGCSAGCIDEDGKSECGNGILEIGEVCEPSISVENAQCGDDCTWAWQCGDGQCSSENGETCQICPTDCCPNCGDHVVDNSNEQCDSEDLLGLTCEDLGYEGGELGCTASCAFDTSSCTGNGPICGNGIIETGEECDGSNLNDNNCNTLGFDSGTLFCGNNCKLNTSGCSGQFIFLREHFDDPYSNHGWTFVGTWEKGKVSNVGPSSCFDGSMCLGTNIDGNAPDDLNYASEAAAISPVFHVPNDKQVAVIAMAWCDLYVSSYGNDEGWTIEYSIDGGQTWNPVENPEPNFDNTVSGHSFWQGVCTSQWKKYVAYLPDSVLGQDVQIRFKAIFDHYSDRPGVYIDDVIIVDRSKIPVSFISQDNLGTVMTQQNWTYQLQASGGSGAYTFTKLSGQNDDWVTVSDTGLLSGTPTESNQGQTTLNIKVSDSNNPQNYAVKTFTISVATGVFISDFEGDTSGWSVSSPWAIGTPTSGPSSCPSGNKCVGTNLSGNYPNSVSWACITSPNIQAPSSGPSGNLYLSFNGWMNLESDYDGVKIEIYDGSTWVYMDKTKVDPQYQKQVDGDTVWAWSGEDMTWNAYSVNITQYAGSTIKVRWCLYSDSSINHEGFFFDDVTIVAY